MVSRTINGAGSRSKRAANRLGLGLRHRPGFIGCASSGGFTQLRYQFNRRFFTLGRYEGTHDPTNGFTRDGVALFGYGPREHSRMTIEDVIAHVRNDAHA